MSDKLLLILRGLPGSGKSTFSKAVIEEAEKNGLTVRVYSTDNYWMIHGRFNPDELPLAHAWNFNRAATAMIDGINVVIIDNTNIKREHFANYIAFGQAHGYDVKERVVGEFTDKAVLEYYYRNIHDVPLHTIKRMAQEFEP